MKSTPKLLLVIFGLLLVATIVLLAAYLNIRGGLNSYLPPIAGDINQKGNVTITNQNNTTKLIVANEDFFNQEVEDIGENKVEIVYLGKDLKGTPIEIDGVHYGSITQDTADDGESLRVSIYFNSEMISNEDLADRNASAIVFYHLRQIAGFQALDGSNSKMIDDIEVIKEETGDYPLIITKK